MGCTEPVLGAGLSSRAASRLWRGSTSPERQGQVGNGRFLVPCSPFYSASVIPALLTASPCLAVSQEQVVQRLGGLHHHCEYRVPHPLPQCCSI